MYCLIGKSMKLPYCILLLKFLMPLLKADLHLQDGPFDEFDNEPTDLLLIPGVFEGVPSEVGTHDPTLCSEVGTHDPTLCSDVGTQAPSKVDQATNAQSSQVPTVPHNIVFHFAHQHYLLETSTNSVYHFDTQPALNTSLNPNNVYVFDTGKANERDGIQPVLPASYNAPLIMAASLNPAYTHDLTYGINGASPFTTVYLNMPPFNLLQACAIMPLMLREVRYRNDEINNVLISRLIYFGCIPRLIATGDLCYALLGVVTDNSPKKKRDLMSLVRSLVHKGVNETIQPNNHMYVQNHPAPSSMYHIKYIPQVTLTEVTSYRAHYHNWMMTRKCKFSPASRYMLDRIIELLNAYHKGDLVRQIREAIALGFEDTAILEMYARLIIAPRSVIRLNIPTNTNSAYNPSTSRFEYVASKTDTISADGNTISADGNVTFTVPQNLRVIDQVVTHKTTEKHLTLQELTNTLISLNRPTRINLLKCFPLFDHCYYDGYDDYYLFQTTSSEETKRRLLNPSHNKSKELMYYLNLIAIHVLVKRSHDFTIDPYQKPQDKKVGQPGKTDESAHISFVFSMKPSDTTGRVKRLIYVICAPTEHTQEYLNKVPFLHLDDFKKISYSNDYNGCPGKKTPERKAASSHDSTDVGTSSTALDV